MLHDLFLQSSIYCSIPAMLVRRRLGSRQPCRRWRVEMSFALEIFHTMVTLWHRITSVQTFPTLVRSQIVGVTSGVVTLLCCTQSAP